MSRHVIVFVAVVLLVAYASAEPDQGASSADSEHFSVSPVGDSALLLDAQTGRSWLLEHPASDYMPSVWVPMNRLDDKEDVMRWRAEQAELSALQTASVE